MRVQASVGDEVLSRVADAFELQVVIHHHVEPFARVVVGMLERFEASIKHTLFGLIQVIHFNTNVVKISCLLYTSPSPRD